MADDRVRELAEDAFNRRVAELDKCKNLFRKAILSVSHSVPFLLFIACLVGILGVAGHTLAARHLGPDSLLNAVTGPIGHVLILIAIVVGGLMMASGKSDSMRLWAGILFLGMAIGALNFLCLSIMMR